MSSFAQARPDTLHPLRIARQSNLAGFTSALFQLHNRRSARGFPCAGRTCVLKLESIRGYPCGRLFFGEGRWPTGYLSAVRMAHAGLRLTLRFLQMVESRAIIILHCWGRGLFGGIGFVLKKCHLVFVLCPCVIDNALRFPWGMYEIGFVFLTSIRVVGGAETKRRRFDIVYNFPECSLQLFPGTRMEHVGPLGTLGFCRRLKAGRL